MEPIEFTVEGLTYTALPQDDGSFDIFQNNKHLGRIFADIGINTELKWASSDLIDLDLVQKMGEAIERKEL